MRVFSVRAARGLFTLAAMALVTATNLGAQQVNAAKVEPPKTPQDEIINAERYVLPPESIRKLVDAPRESNFNYGATTTPGSRKYIMRTVGDGPPSLAAMSQTYYRLGGWEVDWSGNRARTMTTRNSIAIELYDWAANKTTKVELPAGARVSSASWSPDGKSIAYIANFVDATHIYLADPVTGKSKALTKTPLLATKVTSLFWTNSGNSIVAVALPDNRPAPPKEPMTALAPRVRVNEDNLLKTRTNPSLLESEHEKNLVEYYMTGQLVVIDVKTGKVTKIGTPGMIMSVSPSSDAKAFRVVYREKPFSYLIPEGSFGSREVLIDETGKVLLQTRKTEINEGRDPDSVTVVPAGGRGAAAATPPAQTPAQIAAAQLRADTTKTLIGWNPYGPGMLVTMSVPDTTTRAAAPAADTTAGAAGRGNGGRGGGRGGQGGRGGAGTGATALVPRATRIMQWLAPFDSTGVKEWYRSEYQLSNIRWSDNGRIMFVNEASVAPATGTFYTAIYLDEGNKRYVIANGPAGGGGGNNPAGGRGAGGGAPGQLIPAGGRGGGAGGGGNATNGSWYLKPGSRGNSVVMLSSDGSSVFQQGNVPDTAQGNRPYVDKIDIKTGTKTRLYEAETKGEYLETIVTPLDDDFNKAIITRESAKMPAQSYLLDLKTKVATQLTNNRDLTPEITNTIKRTVKAKRADGYTFNIKVTLPAGYKEGTRLPALFWFYPSEFENQAAYDRGQAAAPASGPGRFPTTGARTMSFITAAGYALIEPDAPIFAQNGMLPNDSYVTDLRNDLLAAIDALDTLQLINRHQLAIGGHSYGAFSAVNAMVHTPFFKAGIAGDGAYNRTLTPNGFQSEQRTLWQGRDTYLAMSPFLYADRLNGALLMYHSIDDQNVGTDPINSIKLYHALQGLGKTTALYMYPYEDHGPAARETNLDQWARWVAWLDKYVKGTPPKTAIP